MQLTVPNWFCIWHLYCPASLGSTLTMMSSWLSAVKKCLSVAKSGLLSLLQTSCGRGEPLAWHFSTAVSPLFTVLSDIGFTNLKSGELEFHILCFSPKFYLGTSKTLRGILVVMVPAKFVAVQVYTPMSSALTFMMT